MLHLEHGARTRLVRAGERLGDDTVESGAFERVEPLERLVATGRRGRDVERRLRVAEQPLETGAPVPERLVEQGLAVEREQVERDVRGGDLGRELPDTRLRGVLAQLERVEVEPLGRRDHELAVEHDLVRCLREQRFAHLREIAEQRLLVAALQVEVVAVTEHDAAEAVPLRFEQEVGLWRHVARQLRQHRLERRADRERHAAQASSPRAPPECCP